MNKEFGKLTANQFREFVGLLPQLRQESAWLRKTLQELPKDKRHELFAPGSSWEWIYELSLIQHVVLLVYALGRSDTLDGIVKSPDPMDSLRAWVDEDASESHHPDFEIQDIIALLYSLSRSIESVFLFERSLSGLVQEVRDDGNIDSLFKAISVDRSVLACPSVVTHIANAEMFNDKGFFKQLRTALNGPSKKNMAALADMKYSFAILRELQIDKLSDDNLEELMVRTLKVYADSPSSRKNLRAHYQKSKKLKTI